MNSPTYFDSAQVTRWADPNRVIHTDLLVYGATSAGIVAAITARRLNMSVTLVHPGAAIGGMTTGGLTYTDLGNSAVVGGIAREFYRSVGAKYGWDEAWTFEPSVAVNVFEYMLHEAGISPLRWQFLESVTHTSNRAGGLHEARFLGGLTVRSAWFLDATYEGDLMAAAGVPFTVGREDNSTYGETTNGQQLQETHQFDSSVSPFRTEGDPDSGLLPFVESISDGVKADLYRCGSGDRRVQAYNFRVCMTRDPEIRVDFAKPDGYEVGWYELAARWLRDTKTDVFSKFDLVTPNKTDTNNHGAVSTDFIGGSQGWPEGTYREREQIFQEHIRWQKGLHWFMARDERVPLPVRRRYAQWGLAADEFTDTGNWPHHLYVREGRRMVSDYVVTEDDCLSLRRSGDPVAMGAYTMDSHNCRRIVIDGRVRNEGDIQIHLPRPYGISWRAIVPPKGSCPNLAIPVCVSASHIAFGSIRMEPVFMMLAESAVIGINIARRTGVALQDVPYRDLAAALGHAGQVLDWDSENPPHGNPVAHQDEAR